jgi:hypothetical protein
MAVAPEVTFPGLLAFAGPQTRVVMAKQASQRFALASTAV